MKSWLLLLNPRILPSSCILTISSPSLVEAINAGNVKRLNFLFESRNLILPDYLPVEVFDEFPPRSELRRFSRNISFCWILGFCPA